MSAIKTTPRLSPTDRAQAERLASALQRFRSVDPKVTVEEVLTLLMVAAQPGIIQRDIGETLELKSGSLSRIMGRLTRRGDRETPGLELIHTVEDTQDWRQKLLHLTNGGNRLVADALRDLEGGSPHVSPVEGE
jgi:DNA-binding MarR family transcriptional regulator